jgi:hypothetical protein
MAFETVSPTVQHDPEHLRALLDQIASDARVIMDLMTAAVPDAGPAAPICMAADRMAGGIGLMAQRLAGLCGETVKHASADEWTFGDRAALALADLERRQAAAAEAGA